VPAVSALIRVGHRGAPALAPDNTISSFDAALAVGVDMIEFDVLPDPASGMLYVAHDRGALDVTRSLTLSAALAHFATPPFAATRLQLDIKRRGIERSVLEALDASGTRPRAFVSGLTDGFRAIAPGLALGWTVPDGPLAGRLPLLRARYRERLPARAAARIAAGEIDALVPHWRLVSEQLVGAVRDAGGEIYVWTVDDAAELERLAGLGVTGVITNDPRLFASMRQSAAL